MHECGRQCDSACQPASWNSSLAWVHVAVLVAKPPPPDAHAGVLPELVGLLASTASTPERLEAAHALSSIAAGNPDVAHAVLELQPMPHLVALLLTPDLSSQTAAALCLAELTEQCHMQVRLLLSSPPYRRAAVFTYTMQSSWQLATRLSTCVLFS